MAVGWIFTGPATALATGGIYLSGIKIPVVASGGMVWYCVVELCLVVWFVAFILRPKTIYLRSFWGAIWGSFWDTLWLHFGGLGLPRGPQGDPLQAKVDFRCFGEVLPPPSPGDGQNGTFVGRVSGKIE